MSLLEIDVYASCLDKNTNQNRFASCSSPRLSGHDFMRSSLAGHHTFVRVAPPHPSELRPRNCATHPTCSRYRCMPSWLRNPTPPTAFRHLKADLDQNDDFLNGSSLSRSSTRFQSPSEILRHRVVLKRKTRPHTRR
ncbi:unnamed protein product, partial [Ectocarpus sp. 12 AP-2014]